MRYVFGFLMALAVLGFVACVGDECAEPVDVAGEWEATSTVEFDECEEREVWNVSNDDRTRRYCVDG